jgi:hypothetical protein
MLDESIYKDKVIMFKTDGPDALKAVCEIDRISWIDARVFESFILVTADSRIDNDELRRSFDKEIKKVISILDKYNIQYKAKQLMF